MKPIEPGCRAICIHPTAMGLECTVLRFVAIGGAIPEVGPVIASFNSFVVRFDDGDPGCYQPFYLIRIDGHTEQQKEREAETC
jgi:hypothetical protein